MMGFFFTKEGSGWMLANAGLGPAIVRWFTVYVDNEPQRTWNDVLKKLDIGTTLFEFNVVYPGDPIRPGETGGRIFWIAPGPQSDALTAKRGRVRLEICYCSIYEECWKLTTVFGSRQTMRCESEVPKYETLRSG
jgi:hypothetical protein